MNVIKPKRFAYAILCVLLSFACLLTCAALFVSCGSREPDYQSFDMYFINKFARKDDIINYHISELTCYILDRHYYYDVVFTEDNNEYIGPDEELELLYIIYDTTPENMPRKYKNVQVPIFDTFFNIQHEDDCYRYFESQYTSFIKAKKEGIVRTFTQDEIHKLIDDYLASPDTLY